MRDFSKIAWERKPYRGLISLKFEDIFAKCSRNADRSIRRSVIAGDVTTLSGLLLVRKWYIEINKPGSMLLKNMHVWCIHKHIPVFTWQMACQALRTKKRGIWQTLLKEKYMIEKTVAQIEVKRKRLTFFWERTHENKVVVPKFKKFPS